MPASSPRVTVAMPVRNGWPTVVQAIGDVLAQTYVDFELLVVDDESSDRTGDRVREIQDHRIRVLRNDRRLGVAGSLNRALGAAQGEFFARMDADDRCAPDRLRRLVEVLAPSPRLGAISTFATYVDRAGTPLGTFTGPLRNYELQGRLLSMCCLLHGTSMFRTRALSDIGGYRHEYEPAEDYDMWLRLTELWQVRQLAEPLYTYVVHDRSQSAMRHEAQLEQVVRALGSALQRRSGGVDADGGILDRHLQRDRVGLSRALLHQLIWARNRAVNGDTTAARKLASALGDIRLSRRGTSPMITVDIKKND